MSGTSLRRFACAALLAASLSSLPARAADDAPFLALVDTLIATPPVDHATVSRLTGIKLELAFSGALNDYEAADGALDNGGPINAILYREPVAGLGSMAGPMLQFDPSGKCIAMDTVMARYPGLSASGDAIAHSAKEQTYYSRAEAWGKLSFGFPGRAGKCLKSVSFTLHAPE